MNVIYWILAIAVMSVLLVSTIYNLIDSIRTNDDFKEINKKHIEYLEKQIELLNEMESEEK